MIQLSTFVFLMCVYVSSCTDLDASCSSITTCNSSPCGCSESNNCNVCNEGSGCTQCSSNYFAPNANSQCMLCSLIENCDHCSNGNGCQQCNDVNNCQRVQNSCGLWVCDCGNNNNPTPVSLPSSMPTSAPTSSQDELSAISSNANELMLQGVSTEWLDLFRDDARICFSGFDECFSKQDVLDHFFGICDLGAITYRSDFIDMTFAGTISHTSTACRACMNSNVGLFWLNFQVLAFYDDSALITEAYYTFRDQDTVLANLNAIYAAN